jgi:hypothetical protein
MGALQNGLSRNFCGAQCSSGIGGEKRVTCSAGQNEHTTFLQVTLCTATNVRLCDLWHFNSRHHSRILTNALECILQRKTIHDGGKHSHEVGLCLVHTLTSTFHAAPKVTATNNNSNVNTKLFMHFVQLGCYLMQDVGVETKTCGLGKSFTRQF